MMVAVSLALHSKFEVFQNACKLFAEIPKRGFAPFVYENPQGVTLEESPDNELNRNGGVIQLSACGSSKQYLAKDHIFGIHHYLRLIPDNVFPTSPVWFDNELDQKETTLEEVSSKERMEYEEEVSNGVNELIVDGFSNQILMGETHGASGIERISVEYGSGSWSLATQQDKLKVSSAVTAAKYDPDEAVTELQIRP